MRKISSVLIVIVGIALAACTQTSLVPSVSTEIPTNAQLALPTEISTQVPNLETATDDALKNLTYIVDGQLITLVNGLAEIEISPGSASKQVTRFFGNEVEIDLNSDGLMDSAFLLQQESGGSGTFYFIAAAIKTLDGYLGTNALFLGDRIAPQSTNIDPNKASQFIVNYADRNEGEPMSSLPTVGVSRTFKLENVSLVEVVTSSEQTP